MLGEEMSDETWQKLSAKLASKTCPNCKKPWARQELSIRPLDHVLYVRCRRCGTVFLMEESDGGYDVK